MAFEDPTKRFRELKEAVTPDFSSTEGTLDFLTGHQTGITRTAIEQSKRDLGLGDPETLQAPPLSDQEKRIIAQMKELALGDPELTQLYSDFTLRAIKGEEGVTPGLQRDIAEQEAITKEQIARGLGSEGARKSTPGIRRLGRFREGANIAREDARIGAIGRGERLLASGAGRSISAARAALDPLAAQRNLQTQIGLQNVANIRGTQAGQAQLLGQTGTALLTSGK